MVDIGIFIKKYFNIGKNSALTTVKVVEKYETKTKKIYYKATQLMLAIWLECDKIKGMAHSVLHTVSLIVLLPSVSKLGHKSLANIGKSHSNLFLEERRCELFNK